MCDGQYKDNTSQEQQVTMCDGSKHNTSQEQQVTMCDGSKHITSHKQQVTMSDGQSPQYVTGTSHNNFRGGMKLQNT